MIFHRPLKGIDMNRTKGLVYGIIAAFIYGFTPILGKLSYLGGSNTISLTFYRSFLSLPFIYIILHHKKVPLKLNKSELKKLLILAALGPTLTSLTLYGAYNYISVGMTTTIHYIYPVLVTFVCIVFFKEKLTKEKIISLTLSTIGISLFFEGNPNLTGIIIAFFSGVIYATHLLFLNKSKADEIEPIKVAFYICLFASIYTFLFGVTTNTLVFSMTFNSWIYTFLVSIFVSVLANIFLQLSVRNIGATMTSIVGMFEPITSVLLGIIFLQEPITIKNIIACILILIGVSIISISKTDTPN